MSVEAIFGYSYMQDARRRFVFVYAGCMMCVCAPVSSLSNHYWPIDWRLCKGDCKTVAGSGGARIFHLGGLAWG
jgi:hypothetical protein